MSLEEPIPRITNGVSALHLRDAEDDSEDDIPWSLFKGDQEDTEQLLKDHNLVCREGWMWSVRDCSPEVTLLGDARRDTAYFHPHWSNGTAGVRSDRPLVPGAVHYWEVRLGERVFGTSLMVGVSTPRARLHTKEFKCLLGEDAHGWGLSHRGRVHHAGLSWQYCEPFTEYTPVSVGVALVDGQLSFYKDGVCLGVAFTNLADTKEPLYPTCTSTAAKTVMTLRKRLRSFTGLQDRCRQAVCGRLHHVWGAEGDLAKALDGLPVPKKMRDYLRLGFWE